MLAKFVTLATLLATATAATATSQASPTTQDVPTSQTSGRSRSIGRTHTSKPHATGGSQASPTPGPAGGTPGKCTIGTLMCCAGINDPHDLGIMAVLDKLAVVPIHQTIGGIGMMCNPITADSVGCIAQLACCSGQNAVVGEMTFDCVPVGPGGPYETVLSS